MSHFKSLLIALGLLTGITAQAAPETGNECLLKNPVHIGTNDPRVHPDQKILLNEVKFDRPFKTGGITPDYDKRNMVMELFNLQIDQEPSVYAGFSFRPDNGQPWWSKLGFSHYYTSKFQFKGGVQTQNGTNIFFSHVFLGNHPTFEEPAVVELTVAVRNKHITSFRITIPMETGCEVVGNNAYCTLAGKNETLCLKSAKVSQADTTFEGISLGERVLLPLNEVVLQ